MTADLPLRENVHTPLSEYVLLLLGLSAGMSAVDSAIFKKNYESETTALIILNGEMEDTRKILKSREESRLLMKRNSETSF